MILPALLLLPAAPPAQDAPDFQSEVRPLLVDRCFSCHGPDEASREAGLRLDRREEAHGLAIVPGDAAASPLVQRIRAHDEGLRMPPPESKLGLTPEEQDVLVRWIEAGASYDEHWAFVAPRRGAGTPESAWQRDHVDGHILAAMAEHGESPAPEVDRATWLRRVHLALTGLPPGADEVRDFVAGDVGREQVVDELLSSWAHAEHLAVGWLDLARYADTYGYQNDRARDVWPWRDWLLNALHDNKPYDRFVEELVAGDLLPDADRQSRLATAFQRLHRQTNEGGSVEEEYRVEHVADRTQTFGTAFLGLTLECARCHDHKFDPISQREYFELFAFFDDIDESGLYSHFTNSVPTPALDLATPEQESQLAELDSSVDVAEEAVARIPDRAPDPGRGLQSVHLLDGGLEPAFEGPAAAGLGGVQQWTDGGVELTGDDGLTVPGVGHFRRWDPFSISLRVRLPESYERAVILHRSRAWTDAASRGYELLVEEGRASAALIHFWPGDALRVRTLEPLPVGRWVHLSWTYDGSSRAEGVHLFVDGHEAEVEVIRDGLRRGITGGGEGHLTLGERFRDNGLAGGVVRELVVHTRELLPAEVETLAAGLDWSTAGFTATDAELDEAEVQLRDLRRQRDELRDRVRQIMTMRDMAEPRTAHVLARGAYDARGEAVAPGTPAALPGLESRGESPDRLDLARWLVAPDHPLTARVEVDRLWRLVFGSGLVTTPEDFGLQGAAPEHPQLLDELARDLVDSGWDRRALLRRLVLSATFAQELRLQDEARELPWLGRRERIGLPAEAVRDALLAASGLLVEKVGGPSVKPYQPAGIWKETSGQTYQADRGEGLWRRSLYTFWKRTAPPPSMLMFGAPSRELCVARRPRARTPQQALALWNDPQAVESARVLAERVLAAGDPAGGATDDERLRHATRSCWSREPSMAEEDTLLALLGDSREHYSRDAEAAALLIAVGEAPAAEVPSSFQVAEETGPGAWAQELAAWTAVIQVLWSHEEATTIP